MLKIVAAAALSSMVLAATASAADAPPPHAPPTIRVVAKATVRAKPDQAEIELGVVTDKKAAAAAVSENQKKMEKVLAAVKKELGADGEVRTSEVSVHPRFDESPRTGRPTERVLGYTATNTIHVRFTNIKAVGNLLDVAFQAGATRADELEFTMKDPEAAQNQALREASAKARARATAMAEGQGLHVGDVISVTEGQSYGNDDSVLGVANLRANVANNVSPTSSIESGSIAVTATVTVVFALKPR